MEAFRFNFNLLGRWRQAKSARLKTMPLRTRQGIIRNHVLSSTGKPADKARERRRKMHFCNFTVENELCGTEPLQAGVLIEGKIRPLAFMLRNPIALRFQYGVPLPIGYRIGEMIATASRSATIRPGD
jgi:hypothetical protein